MHNTVRFPASFSQRRWRLLVAGVFLLIPTLLAACATENSTSETVIVTSDNPEAVLVEEIEGDLLRVEEMEAMAKREKEMVLMERQRAFEEAELRFREAAEYQEVRARERAFNTQHTEKEYKRLAVQMEYLQMEIQKLAKEVDAKSGHEAEIFYQRIQLLNSMYLQRLEKFETMKMEKFTSAALADSE